MKTLTLLKCYDVVSKDCDRLEGIERQIGKGSTDRSPPYFWQKIFYRKQYEKREEEEDQRRRNSSIQRKKALTRTSSSQFDLGQSGRVFSSRALNGKEEDQSSKEDTQESTTNDKDQQSKAKGLLCCGKGETQEPTTNDKDQQSKRKGAPVFAKLNPLKDCAAKKKVNEASFLQALIFASEETNDFRVWENEVIISIVQFKWDTQAKYQYTVHFVLAILMVVTFAIDAAFIVEAQQLPAYSEDWRNATFMAYRTPLTICFFIWLYFFQHEIYQKKASLKKFREKLRKKDQRDGGMCMSLRKYMTFRYYAQHVAWFFRELFGSIWEFLDAVSLIFLLMNFISMFYFTVEIEDDMASTVQSYSYWVRFVASIVTLPVLSLNTLYYLQGFEASGQLVRMIIGIVKGVRVYVGIMFIIMSGFSMAFYMFFKLDDDGSKKDDFNDCYEEKSFRNPAETLLMSYGVMLGEVGKPQKDYTANSNWIIAMVGVTLFVVFTFIINIVMLNLLIAIMGDIFDKIQENAKAEFMFAKAGIICEFEATPGFFKRKMENLFLTVSEKDKYPNWIQVLQPESLEIEEGGLQNGQTEWTGRIRAIRSGQDKICADVGTMKKDINRVVMKTSQKKISVLEKKIERLEQQNGKLVEQNEQILELLRQNQSGSKT
ncbi:hypothetical protein TrST_g4109 [Triparma strigata]|uniref:Ion transport domain-containing protein n=1 Tax=Triparma strigata TaxID=1606541 RepID=A0A9W7ARR5_9STRA|nr:hypothetical protein TrST_g4109 [Triparma strigata]